MYTCAGTGCDLSASTTYFVTFRALSAPGGSHYPLNVTTSDNETLTPSGNGWSIANAAVQKNGASAWAASGGSYTAKIKVTAEAK